MKNNENEFLAAHAAWLAAGARLNRDVQPFLFETPDDERIKALIREHEEAHRRYMEARAKYNELLRGGRCKVIVNIAATCTDIPGRSCVRGPYYVCPPSSLAHTSDSGVNPSCS